MIVYHGTTRRRAERICAEGFLPKKPSKRVWFAKGHGYALHRAKTQARRSHDRPIVLTCEINVGQMREKFGKKRVMDRHGILAIDAPVPVAVLRSHFGPADQPVTHKELATWVNRLLRLKAYKGVSPRHPGINRLSRWVVNRLSTQSRSIIPKTQLVEMARRWLPEFFEDVVVDLKRLHAFRRVRTIRVSVDVDTMTAKAHEREDEAVGCLADPSPKRRVRGLAILAESQDPDLFDWCAMHLGDESLEVRVAALHTMRLCEEGDPEVIAPLASSDDKRVRGAAIAALARHAGKDAARWVERGLKDPDPCVRLEAVALLPELDPAKHPLIFDLALHDLNPSIVRRAEKLTGKKGHYRQRPRTAQGPTARR
jgi:hypothetical protein